MADLDFRGLNEQLLVNSRALLTQWLPGGSFQGHEYLCGSLVGGKGRSFSVNTETGKWAEFNGLGGKGGDLISLYAAIRGVGQGDAFKELAKEQNFGQDYAPAAKAPEKPKIVITDPPVGTPPPRMDAASMFWEYKNRDGSTKCFVARFERDDGKDIRPLSWDSTSGKWVYHGYPAPRPLYGLELLDARPQASVLLVEGEKSAIAARQIVGDRYIVMTWLNGALAENKADWKPIYGRKVLIWGDADLKVYPDLLPNRQPHPQAGQLLPHEEQPGHRAAQAIAKLLQPHCPEVKILDPGRDETRKDGWDAADALAEGWDWNRLKEFAAGKIAVYAKKEEAPPPLLAPPPGDEQEVVPEPPDGVKASAAAMVKGKDGSKMGAAAHVQVDLPDHGEAEGQKEAFSKVWADIGLSVTKGGAVANVDNVLRVLENRKEFTTSIWFDEFYGKIFTSLDLRTWEMDQKPREWRDIDTLYLTAFMQRHLGMTKVAETMVDQAVRVHAHSNVMNAPQDWLNGLVWDKEPRIDEFFWYCFGVESTEYSRAVSRNFWIGLVARILDPGCQVDTMVILEGEQGRFKSTALKDIGGEWATETKESILSKDFFITMQGIALVIVNELHTFGRADMNIIKNVITTAKDRYRPPYGRAAVDHPRTCVFVGTTNKQLYLSDPTGGRRFHPLKTKKIDRGRVRAIREQCFAEAVARYKAGETWHEMPVKETQDEQEARREPDAWEPVIEHFLTPDVYTEIRIIDIWRECLNRPAADIQQRDSHRIGDCLRALGWESHISRVDGKTAKVFRKREE